MLISKHSNKNKLSPVYDLRQNFIILGLTGRTGSGCTSISNYLSQSNFKNCGFLKPSTPETNDERKDIIVYNYLKQNWKPFTIISVANIISAYLLENKFPDILIYFKNVFSSTKTPKKQIEADLNKIKKKFDSLQIKYKRINNNKEKLFNFYFKDDQLTQFTSYFKESVKNYKSNTESEGTVYQTLGNNLRSSGNALSSEISLVNVYTISNQINALIKAIEDNQKNLPHHIAIDSIRNSIESMFFKERYSAYYLIAVNSEDKYRYDRLFTEKKLSKEQIDVIDEKEYKSKRGNEKYVSQDIRSCIENSDIYIHNPTDDKPGDTYRSLKKQLIKYLSLILHPGLITPSPVERCMQIAYTAKYNSGCISRQVGAVISDKYFSIKAVGWNNTAEGQVPCLLRNINDLFSDDKIAYSNYELDDIFKNEVKKIYKMTETFDANNLLEGRNISICFKDIKNGIDGEKNQVHTRSLHAEENAFLQITKYGGEGIHGGYLFTTSSPCELCSKKAYQLGITKIYYIEPYPGISRDHILNSGINTNRPTLKLFSGAIGKAYHQLYQPFIPYKDELQMILNLKFKNKKEELIKNNISLENKNNELTRKINRLKGKTK